MAWCYYCSFVVCWFCDKRGDAKFEATASWKTQLWRDSRRAPLLSTRVFPGWLRSARLQRANTMGVLALQVSVRIRAAATGAVQSSRKLDSTIISQASQAICKRSNKLKRAGSVDAFHSHVILFDSWASDENPGSTGTRRKPTSQRCILRTGYVASSMIVWLRATNFWTDENRWDPLIFPLWK